MTEMRKLYPLIEPYQVGMLKVSSLHTLYFEEVGNPAGTPVVFLHGGPGVGAQIVYRRFFDPQRFRVVIFSQRGAGKSTPSGELNENTTWDIIGDIEKLRNHLGIDRWFLFGGSWGSTLALCYSIQHPQPVRGMVLRGIYLGNQAEDAWLYRGGAAHVFPEAWERFTSFIPTDERSDIVQAYYRRLTSENLISRFEAANHWYDWEDDIIRLLPRQTARMEDDELVAFARIECHYMVNKLFLPGEDFITREIPRIRHIPVWIAHGRYDMVCPVASAVELARQLPKSELHIIPDAGHSIREPGLVDSLIEGIEAFSARY